MQYIIVPMMTQREQLELDRLEAKNARDSIHFLTVAEMDRLLWLRKEAKGNTTTVQCANCGAWVDVDDFVWRGRYGDVPICTHCEPEGDDCR